MRKLWAKQNGGDADCKNSQPAKIRRLRKFATPRFYLFIYLFLKKEKNIFKVQFFFNTIQTFFLKYFQSPPFFFSFNALFMFCLLPAFSSVRAATGDLRNFARVAKFRRGCKKEKNIFKVQFFFNTIQTFFF